MTAPATAERVSDLFLRLGNDPGLLAEYCRDPGATMAATGLSSAQVATVLDGEPERVRALVDAEFAADLERRRLIVTPRMIIMTQQDPDGKPAPKPPKPKPGPKPKPKPK